jgi:N12 class adenine-specific DNA methylase
MAEVPTEETENIGPIRRARHSLAALETLERLRQAPNTAPSPDELAALRGWSGWGPLAPALEYNRAGTWREIGERLGSLLSAAHYKEGMQATFNAFYTPPELASACWRILTDLGFPGGKILEPGCGAGAFMARTPDDIGVRWTGVERDPSTAAIAAALHPAANIQAKRFEEASLPSASMDAVLGNVPFGDVAVYDPTAPWEVTRSLHNYFIWRSVQALRPGGIAVLITSRYTLDAYGDEGKAVRSALAWDADLLGAIRMPNRALADGGTEALADILVLRKRRPDDVRPEGEQPQWIKTGFTHGQPINEYFIHHPEMVLGELSEDRVPRYGRTLRVDARPDDPAFPTALAAATQAIVERAGEHRRTWRVDTGATAITAETAPFELRADGKKEGSFHLVDGAVHEVVESVLTPVARPGKELPKLIALRDATVALLDAEADHARPDVELEPLRARANQAYDAYVNAHGFLNRFTVVEGKPDEDGVAVATRRRPTMGGFRRDPDYVTVLALEDFDDDTRTATKAALLERRVNRPRQRAARAESPTEAVALCRDELGRIEPARVAELLDVEPAEAEQRLAEVAYLDPDAGAWAPADQYLTGNVRAKLAAATTAASGDPERYGRNVAALEAVQPADLEPEQIYAGLGASWIPASDVRAFAEDLLGFDVRIWHEPRTSMWSVTTSQRAEESAIATSEWGTGRWNAYKLLEAGLNGKAPVVYDLIDDVRVRNQDETIAANDRLDAIASRFSAWVWEDPDRADRLAAAYNENFNAVVPRRFDGAHLTFPGLDADFTPYAHQADMVARMISGDDALCPYPVGTGKTATMFMAAAKLKALGLAQKPLIVVVPSTLEQIARDGKRLFPNSRILMAGKDDLRDARARKLFAARCAMEDWDAVVMSHPSFTSLPVHATVQAEHVANLADQYRTALISAKSADASPRKIKQISKMVQQHETAAKNLLRHATDDGVFFEHLGVDYLLVDEMHYFKNRGVPVHTDGFQIQGSKRAQDLAMKIDWLRRQHPDLAVVTGFTGTPVSNTLLEAYILQHYLQPQRLEELGILSADAWAADFVRFATAVEITPDGSFRLNRRPAEIVNIPELMHTLGEVAELRPPESFPVTRPEVRRHNIAVQASDTVVDFVTHLGERADAIHAGGVPAYEDNMLKICSDGRKVALHESLVGFPPDGPGKIGTLTSNIARIHHQTKDLEIPGGHDPGVTGRLQLVFCDLGTPNKDKGSQVYGLIRRQLIEAGVPAERIRFIHDAATDAQRLTLFDQCNKGEINVLIGSTDKLGVGVNVQRRAIALHHVDAPWRPDQVEQRDGRVWRPKNLNPEVEIYRYVTEGSFDAFMWQALERKEKALRPILSGQATARSIEDIGDVALDYGQIKAISTGNPLLAELAEANVEVKRLASLSSSFQRNQRRLRNDIQTFTMQAAHAVTQAEAYEAVAKTAERTADGSSWKDNKRNRNLEHNQELTVLADLAQSTIAKGYCDGSLGYRGITVDFSYSKNSPEGELTARITSEDNHRITVELNPKWTAPGQHWRIRDAIAAALHDASSTAVAIRENIEVLKQKIAENEAALDQTFPEAEALHAARAHKAAIDTAIREQADKDEQARRARKARGPATASPADEQRRMLLTRMHAAMALLAERTSQSPNAQPDTVLPVVDAAPNALDLHHDAAHEPALPDADAAAETTPTPETSSPPEPNPLPEAALEAPSASDESSAGLERAVNAPPEPSVSVLGAAAPSGPETGAAPANKTSVAPPTETVHEHDARPGPASAISKTAIPSGESHTPGAIEVPNIAAAIQALDAMASPDQPEQHAEPAGNSPAPRRPGRRAAGKPRKAQAHAAAEPSSADELDQHGGETATDETASQADAVQLETAPQPRPDEARLTAGGLDAAPVPDEGTVGPVQNTAPEAVAQEQTDGPEPTAAAHRTGSIRQSWHAPMSIPVDKNPYSRESVYAASCEDCEYLGPWHGREEGAFEDEFDHAFPGWRELLPVVAAMEYNETQNKKAFAQWKQTIVDLYPAGWIEAGGPVLVARNPGGTRWHNDWFLGGNYNICGVERAINLHTPARHKGRTRLVAASYQPREPLPAGPRRGSAGELTEQDISAALNGIFTPGKLLDLGTSLRDARTLKAWLKARGQDSRDEHVGRRPATDGQTSTFDTVTEIRQGLAVVVLTDTERREGMITWPQAAEYLRPALTPEATTRLSELHEEFQRFYTDSEREIPPTLAALHALRERAAAIHQDAANQAPARAPKAETSADDQVVLDSTTTAAAPRPESAELEPLPPTTHPAVPPGQEPDPVEPEPGKPPERNAGEPDYEQLYPEEFAQETSDRPTSNPSTGSPTMNMQPDTTEASQVADMGANDALAKDKAVTEAVSEHGHVEDQQASAHVTPADAPPSPEQNTADSAESEDPMTDRPQQAGDTGQLRLAPDAGTQLQGHAAPTEPTPQAPPPTKGRSTHERSEMLDHAIDLALQGLAVFPLRPGSKVPLFKDWERQASTDIEQIMRWWSATPHANIAIACGPSNLLVIDLDADKTPGSTRHGQHALIKLAAGRGIPATFTVASARGGRHLYYRQPDGARLGNTIGSLGELVDTRGRGGYVVAPGSVFKGGTYRVEREAAVTQLPTWLAEELEQRRAPAAFSAPEQQLMAPVPERRRTAYGQAALRRAAASIESALEGTRNHTLNKEAFRLGQLVGGGILDPDQATSALRRAARTAGLEPEETEKTIASGITAGIQRPRSIPERAPDPKEQSATTTKETTMSTTTTDTPTHDAPPTEAPNRNETTIAPAHEGAPEPAERQGDQLRPDHTPAHDGPEEKAGAGQTPQASTNANADAGQTPDREEPTAALDLDAIFADTQERINTARQALPDSLEFQDFDELQRSIDHLRDHLAQAPIRRRPANPAPMNPASSDASEETRDPQSEQDSDQPPAEPAADLDEHLAAVDAAYTEAQAAGIPADRPQWAGITAIHSAIHNLWDTLKAAAGTYWAELAADARVHGLMTAIAARATRAIAHLANTAANRLDQHADQQPHIEADEPGLRESYINARNQIRGHAATHEWQRITALWGTVNTLTRQTDDPGIRAVVARSADAISDHADTLARKITQYGDSGNAPETLNALARAAEAHATGLRAVSAGTTANTEPASARTTAQPASSNPAASPANRQPDARALQQAAQQVARHAQQRLGLPARPQGGNALRTPVRNRPNAHQARPQQQHTVDQQSIVAGKPGPR